MLAVLEWLYARGLLAVGWASWWGVNGFPELAKVTGDWYIGSDWWWWRSSRVIQDQGPLGEHIEVITEFPFFSFFLGDNHPHLLSLPIVLLLLGFLLNLLLAGRDGISSVVGVLSPVRSPGQRSWQQLGLLLLSTVICLGAVASINTWNIPGSLLLTLIVVWIVWLRESRDLRSLGLLPVVAGLISVALVILFWPFLLVAQGSASGIMLNFYNPTQLRQFLLMFGAFVPATLVLFSLRRVHFRLPWRETLLALCMLSVVPLGVLLLTAWAQLPEPSFGLAFSRWLNSPWSVLALAALVGTSVAFLLAKTRNVERGAASIGEVASTFSLLLLGVGWLLVLIPEFVFVEDVFKSRMNTVFKFHYLAWVLLGLGSSYGVVRSFCSSKLGPQILSSISLACVLLGLVFPVTTLGGRVISASEMRSLDGLRYLAETSPDEWAAIVWIRQNTATDATVLEAIGESYRAESNRISTATGRPTLLGWPGHELQWRGSSYAEMAAGRLEAVELVYQKGGLEEIVREVEKWGIDFVVVGPVERSRYTIGAEREELLGRALDKVFHSGSVTVYQKREW
jgi:YYY domain-containing protein